MQPGSRGHQRLNGCYVNKGRRPGAALFAFKADKHLGSGSNFKILLILQWHNRKWNFIFYFAGGQMEKGPWQLHSLPVKSKL